MNDELRQQALLRVLFRFWESQYREGCDLDVDEVCQLCGVPGFEDSAHVPDEILGLLDEEIAQRRLEINAEQPPPPYENWKPIKRLGGGAFGEVWLAENKVLKQQRVFKYCRRRSDLGSLKNEVQKVVRILHGGGHSGIATILGEHLGLKPPAQPFIEYEYRKGVTLSYKLDGRLVRGECYSPVETAETMLSLCDIMAFAHAKDIIHRDLKPDNILVSNQGGHNGFTILDFGIGGYLKPLSERPKQDRGTYGLEYLGLGTHYYMSPEQVNNDRSPQDDVWALGVIWIELLSGYNYVPLEHLRQAVPLSDWERMVRQLQIWLRDDYTQIPLFVLHFLAGTPATLVQCIRTSLSQVQMTKEQLAVLTNCFSLKQERFPNTGALGTSIRRHFLANILEHYGSAAVAHDTCDDLDAAKAIARFRKAVQVEPKNAAYHNNLGHHYWTARRYDEAIASFQKAVELEPNNALYHHNLSIAYSSADRADEAIAYCRKAVELEPNNAKYHGNLGDYYRSARRYDEAIARYQKAVELEPNNSLFHTYLAEEFSRKGRDEEAIASYRKVVELEPNNADYHMRLSRLYFLANRLNEAIHSVQKAVELEPNNADYHGKLGDSYRVARRYDEAIARHQKAVELEPNNADYHGKRGDSYRIACRYDEAIASYQKAVELEPNNSLFHTYLAEQFSRKGRYEEAIASYRKVVELRPVAIYYVLLGDALWSINRYDEAIASYQKAVELEPNGAFHYNSLAEAYSQKGRYEDAIACWRKSVELDPHISVFQNKLGIAYYSTRHYDEAIVCYRKAVELDPSNAVLHHNLGHAYLSAGRHDEAIASYRKAVELDPNNLSYRNSLGRASL